MKISRWDPDLLSSCMISKVSTLIDLEIVGYTK